MGEIDLRIASLEELSETDADPADVIMEKVGARIWIARIMITWGILAGLTALVTGSTSFGIVRFLLGVAEAGFFPGLVLYFTYWFPYHDPHRREKHDCANIEGDQKTRRGSGPA